MNDSNSIKYKKKGGNIFFSLLRLLIYMIIFYSMYIQIAVKVIPNFMIFLGAICLTSLLLILIINNNNKYSLKFVSSELIIIILFLIYTLLSGFFVSPNLPIMMNTWISISQASIIFILVSYISYNYQNGFKPLINIIMLSAFLLSLSVILFGTETETGRISVGTTNANLVAYVMNIGFITILFKFKGAIITKRIIYIFISFFLILAIVQTGTRQAIIGTYFLLFLYILYCYLPTLPENKNRTIKRIFVPLLLILLLYISYIYLLDMTILGERINSTGYLGDERRIGYYKYAWEMFNEYPFFGLGLNGFAFYTGMYSHSTYAELMSSTGIIGTLLYMSVFIILLQKARKLKKICVTAIDKNQARFCQVILLFFLLIGVSTVHFYELFSYILLGVLSGYISGQLDKKIHLQRIKEEL